MDSQKTNTQPAPGGRQTPAAAPPGGRYLDANLAISAAESPECTSEAPDADGEFLEQTLRVWQPRSGRKLTREDARQIAHNIAGFFRILSEWAAAEPQGAASNQEPTLAESEEGP
jgi:hypothetical protein